MDPVITDEQGDDFETAEDDGGVEATSRFLLSVQGQWLASGRGPSPRCGGGAQSRGSVCAVRVGE